MEIKAKMPSVTNRVVYVLFTGEIANSVASHEWNKVFVNIRSGQMVCGWGGEGWGESLSELSHNVRKCTVGHLYPTQIQISRRSPIIVFIACMNELYILAFQLHRVMDLTRLRECTGWSESSLEACVRRYGFWRCGSVALYPVGTFL